jgi:hypothetical protein
MTSADDAALLARLRALRSSSPDKDSSVQPIQSVTTHTSPHATTLEDRFRSLRLPSSEPDKNISPASAAEEDQFLLVSGKTSESEFEDISQTVAVLEEEKGVGISHFPEVGGLLREAKAISDQYHAPSSTQVDEGPSQGLEEAQAFTHQRSKSENSELAAEYIQQVLDELKAAGLGGEDDAEEPEGEAVKAAEKSTPEEKNIEAGEAESSILDLPSVPSRPSTHGVSNKDTDDDLLARLAALKDTGTLGKSASTSAKTGADLPWTSIGKDEDDSHWCVICCDDATIKCLGCDGDLYCKACWKEGHRSEDAGMEERMHKAVLYQKPGEKKRTRMMAA